MVEELECHGSFKFSGLSGSLVRRLLYHICCGRTEVRDQITFKGSSRLAKFWLADTFLFECIVLVLLIYATENA